MLAFSDDAAFEDLKAKHKFKDKHFLKISDIVLPKNIVAATRAYAKPTYKEYRSSGWYDCTTPIDQCDGYYLRYHGSDVVGVDGKPISDTEYQLLKFVTLDKPLYKFNATTKEKPEDGKNLECLIKVVDKAKEKLYHRYRRKFRRAISSDAVARL